MGTSKGACSIQPIDHAVLFCRRKCETKITIRFTDLLFLCEFTVKIESLDASRVVCFELEGMSYL